MKKYLYFLAIIILILISVLAYYYQSRKFFYDSACHIKNLDSCWADKENWCTSENDGKKIKVYESGYECVCRDGYKNCTSAFCTARLGVICKKIK